MKKFTIEKATIELKGYKADKYFTGITQSDEWNTTGNFDTIEQDKFETLEEARENLKNYNCLVRETGGYTFIDEYFIVEYEYDEDFEEWNYIQMWDFAKLWKIEEVI